MNESKKLKHVAIDEETNTILDNYLDSQYPKPLKRHVVSLAIREYIDRQNGQEAGE